MYIIYYKSFDDFKIFEQDGKEIYFNDLNIKKGFFRKRIVVLSSLSLRYFKFNTPQVNKAKLEKIINFEIMNLFGENKFKFFYQISDELENYLTVNCWLIDITLYDEILKKFKPHYMVPEVFLHGNIKDAIIIEKKDSYYNIMIQIGGNITEYILIRKFDELQIKILLNNITKYKDKVKNVIFFNTDSEIEKENIFENIEKKYCRYDNQYCIQVINNIKLKKYKIIYRRNFDVPLIIIVATIGFILGSSTKVLINNYKLEKILLIQKNHLEILKKISSRGKKESNDNTNELLSSVEKRFEKYNDPVMVLDYIVGIFDNTTQIKLLEFVDNNLKIMIYTSNPFILINQLLKNQCIKNVQIINALTKDKNDKYNVYLSMELNRCIK